MKTDIWNNITAYPHCCIGEGIHSVCVYIEDGKKVIGVPRKAYYKEFRCSIEKDDNTNRYVLSGVKGTPLMYFNNKSNAEQFLSILRNVVNVIIDYYRTL